jgi:hypothetical protein
MLHLKFIPHDGKQHFLYYGFAGDPNIAGTMYHFMGQEDPAIYEGLEHIYKTRIWDGICVREIYKDYIKHSLYAFMQIVKGFNADIYFNSFKANALFGYLDGDEADFLVFNRNDVTEEEVKTWLEYRRVLLLKKMHSDLMAAGVLTEDGEYAKGSDRTDTKAERTDHRSVPRPEAQ